MYSATFERPAEAATPAVLLVDDEIAVLDGLRRQLRRKFTVHTALSGAEGLALLATEPVTVVVSDMRMPEMDGATFLAKVREQHPSVVRILLTGQADTQSAIAAVNQGSIYRFLTKPCPTEVILDELTSAVEMNRLMNAEKELLGTTLRRTVEALVATLSLAQPAAFARAQRIARTARELAEELALEDVWEIEIMAQLSSLGAVALPGAVLAKLDSGRPMTEDEQAMVARMPALSRDLVVTIPRLEAVAEAIGLQAARFDGAGALLGTPRGEDLPIGARLLRVAVDMDMYMSRQRSVERAVSLLYADEAAYDPAVLAALVRCNELDGPSAAPREVQIEELLPGMVIFEDICTDNQMLLVGRGAVVTPALVERLENFASQGRITLPLRVTEGQ